MRRFKIIGKGKESGRNRERIYTAATQNEARLYAARDGTSIESIAELAPEPATVRQLEYAKILGIPVPASATKADLIDLISAKVDNDRPSTGRHRAFAARFDIETTPYVGKRALFDQIQAQLIAPGREKELVSWFVYRVYREIIGGKEDAPIQGPDDLLIQGIANRLAQDQAIIESIRRYSGRDLIWFGTWTAPNGRIYRGGSNRTEAYKAARSLLKETLEMHGKINEVSGIALGRTSTPAGSLSALGAWAVGTRAGKIAA